MSDIAEGQDPNEAIDWDAAFKEQAAAEAAASSSSAAAEAAAPSSAAAQAPAASPAVSRPQFEDFGGRKEPDGDPVFRPGSLDEFKMVKDIPVQITVEMGRTRIPIRKLLQLAHGSVIELDGLAGEPMDVLVNGTLIAKGEVVVINDKFGIRLTDIISQSERMSRLSK